MNFAAFLELDAWHKLDGSVTASIDARLDFIAMMRIIIFEYLVSAAVLIVAWGCDSMEMRACDCD